MTDDQAISLSSINDLPESESVADLHSSLDSTERLLALDELEILDAPVERNFQVLTELANKILETPVCLITLVTNDRQFFVSSNGLGEPWASRRETKLSHSFCQHVVTRNQPLVISNAKSHPLVCDNLAIQDLNVAAYLGCPIVVDNQTLGSFCLIDDKPRPWTADDLLSVRKLTGIVETEIAERKKAIAKQSDLERQLRQSQKMEAIGNLTSGIAHDFNNVLTAIQIHTDLLDSESLDPATTKPHTKNIQSTIDSAKRLVEQLLTWGQPEQARQSTMSLSQTINDAMPLLRAFIPSSIPIVFHDVFDDDLILADRSQIDQILMNLCTNAEHAMRGRRGKITITVDQTRLEPGPEKVTTIDSDNTDCASQYIRLRISDNGVGIPPEILHRVQDPYFTTKPVGQGTGIGLWTVFGIVKNHDGQINIQSVPDQGTTTEILFPKANTVCWQQESQQEVAEPASARILVVDDEPAITDGLHRQLALAGHDVVSFNCGLEALQFLQRDSGRLDLLITDQIMPKISGDDLIREIKSLYPAIGTIVCSGYNPGPKIGSSFENLAHEEISKPFRFSQIALAIDRILNSSERTLKN